MCMCLRSVNRMTTRILERGEAGMIAGQQEAGSERELIPGTSETTGTIAEEEATDSVMEIDIPTPLRLITTRIRQLIWITEEAAGIPTLPLQATTLLPLAMTTGEAMADIGELSCSK